MGAPADGLAIQITMYLIWQRACHRLQSHHTHRETHRALQPRQPRFTLPISTLDPAFLTTCRLLAGTDRPAQPAHPQQPHTARAPAGRRSPTGSWAFPLLNRHAPPLEHARPSLRVPTGSAVPTGGLRSRSKTQKALHLSPGSAARIRFPTTDRKHRLVRLDRRFQKEHSSRHYAYLIGTAQNRHRGPLSRTGTDVLAQQLSRYPGAAAWPAGGRTDDNLRPAAQSNARVGARHCIHRPVGVRHGRGRARDVERRWRTCAAASAPPPKSSRNLCLGWKPVWVARSRTTPHPQLTGTAAPP